MQEQFEWVSFSAPVERERAALQRLAKLSGAESFLKPFQGLTQNIDPDSTSCSPAESETPTRNSVVADTPAPPLVGCLSRAEPRLDVVSEEVHFRAAPLSGGRTAVRAASWETLLARPVHWMFALEGRPALLLVVAGVRTEIVCLYKTTGCLIFSRIVPVPPVVDACCDKDVLCLLSDDCTLAAFRLETSPPGLSRIFYESVRPLLPTLTRPLLSLAPSSAPLLGLSNGQVLCLPSFTSGGWVRVDGLDYGLPPDTSPILPESPLTAIQKFSRLQIDDVKLHDATSDDVSWLRSTLEGLAERTVANEVHRQERPFELHQLMCASYIGSTSDILEWTMALFMLEIAQADLLTAVCRLYFRRTRGGTPVSDVPLPDWIQYWRLTVADLGQLLSQLLGRFFASDSQAEAIGATGFFRWSEGTVCLPEVLADAILSASRLEETGDVIEQGSTSDIVNVVLNM
ncbi:MAG: hypothetical protein KVP17_003203 [Porospora cf. gigantea B]|uniref:uncharacterized protein n=1 Tax=Porospora cf. gigantea B TaxID=2853592 RepID=UPI0035717B5F|nr:MAG: hypothetical protein KVP17_003203 [Porospora cf. gigantea B]